MNLSLAGIKKIFREVLSEPGPNGTLSWGRVASSITLVAALAWVTHLVIHTHALPDFTGVTGFAISPYAANKVATAAQSFSDNPVGKQ